MSEHVLNGNNVVKGTNIPRYVKITALFTFQVPYLEWISTEKTTAIKFHLEKPFIDRDMEPVLNFHGSALGVLGPVPDMRPSSQGAKMDLSKAANLNLLQGHRVLQTCFYKALIYLDTHVFLETLLRPEWKR